MTKEKPPGDDETTGSSTDETNYDSLFSSDNTETTDFFSDNTNLTDLTEKIKNAMDGGEENQRDPDSVVVNIRPDKK